MRAAALRIRRYRPALGAVRRRRFAAGLRISAPGLTPTRLREQRHERQPFDRVRPAQPYVGTRAVMPMSDFPREIPAMTARVSECLDARGLRPSGAPFLRYPSSPCHVAWTWNRGSRLLTFLAATHRWRATCCPPVDTRCRPMRVSDMVSLPTESSTNGSLSNRRLPSATVR